jgi:hypothetical protein
MISGQDIKIIHSGQKAVLTQLKPKKEPEVKTIKIDDKKEPNGSKNDRSGGFQFGLVYGERYIFEVEDFCENVKPKNENTIKWEFRYVNANGVVVIGAFKKRGKKVELKIDDLDMLGTEITIRAYINQRIESQEEKFWIHNRFRWFDKKIFEDELESRLNNPVNFDQHNTSLCGTVAILYVMVKTGGYDKIMKSTFMEFFRSGYCVLNKFLLDPNPDLFEMKPVKANTKYPHYAHDLMQQADWITLVGTRSSDNKSYEGKQGENWDAINWPSYMVKAAKNLYLASQVVDKTFFISGLNCENKLRKIQNEFEQGWNIILLIDADMLNHEVSWAGCLTNYHWIVYEGGLLINNQQDEYTFSYYCWQNLYRNTFKSNVFNTNFYGYIMFKK